MFDGFKIENAIFKVESIGMRHDRFMELSVETYQNQIMGEKTTLFDTYVLKPSLKATEEQGFEKIPLSLHPVHNGWHSLFDVWIRVEEEFTYFVVVRSKIIDRGTSNIPSSNTETFNEKREIKDIRFSNSIFLHLYLQYILA